MSFSHPSESWLHKLVNVVHFCVLFSLSKSHFVDGFLYYLRFLQLLSLRPSCTAIIWPNEFYCIYLPSSVSFLCKNKTFFLINRFKKSSPRAFIFQRYLMWYCLSSRKVELIIPSTKFAPHVWSNWWAFVDNVCQLPNTHLQQSAAVWIQCSSRLINLKVNACMDLSGVLRIAVWLSLRRHSSKLDEAWSFSNCLNLMLK